MQGQKQTIIRLAYWCIDLMVLGTLVIWSI